MKISLVQTHIFWEEKEKNIQVAKKIISKCSKNNVNLILFPEMSFTGFSMNTKLTADDEDVIVKKLSLITRKERVSVGFGWAKNCGEKCENHYTIIDNNGIVLSDYAKIHPFSYSNEDKYFIGGDIITTFQINDIQFSTFICYDLRFPELFRIVADGVHAIIIPANWPAKRSEHWNTLLRARAIENQVYIFAVNCVGDMDGQYYVGDSCIINPNGDVVKVLSDKEGVITYDFIDDVIEYRTSFPLLRDKRPDIYYVNNMNLRA